MFPRWTIDAKKEKITILTTYEFEEASNKSLSTLLFNNGSLYGSI